MVDESSDDDIEQDFKKTGEMMNSTTITGM